MKRVFLAGTQSGSKWRDDLIPMLKIDYFNPVVDDWNDEARDREAIEKAKCDFLLYVITPEMTGCYAIAEAVQSGSRQPGKTIFCVLDNYGHASWSEDQLQSINAVKELIKGNGATVLSSLGEVACHLNQYYVDPEFDPNVLECLIERDGPTEVTLGRTNYKFEKNLAGNSVCEVWFREHRDYLLSLGDFRIYMKHKDKTEPEFTDEEWEFMREFKLLGADRFNAYVNTHIKKFNQSREKIRAIATEKWRALLPNMGCPILLESGQDATEEWIKLDGVQFKKYVIENEGRFRQCDAEILAKAKAKWDRIIFSKTGESCPLVLEPID
jgi:nucleoside 2-deoxyribosyltransferase-like protein